MPNSRNKKKSNALRHTLAAVSGLGALALGATVASQAPMFFKKQAPGAGHFDQWMAEKRPFTGFASAADSGGRWFFPTEFHGPGRLFPMVGAAGAASPEKWEAYGRLTKMISSKRPLGAKWRTQTMERLGLFGGPSWGWGIEHNIEAMKLGHLSEEMPGLLPTMKNPSITLTPEVAKRLRSEIGNARVWSRMTGFSPVMAIYGEHPEMTEALINHEFIHSLHMRYADHEKFGAFFSKKVQETGSIAQEAYGSYMAVNKASGKAMAKFQGIAAVPGLTELGTFMGSKAVGAQYGQQAAQLAEEVARKGSQAEPLLKWSAKHITESERLAWHFMRPERYASFMDEAEKAGMLTPRLANRVMDVARTGGKAGMLKLVEEGVLSKAHVPLIEGLKHGNTASVLRKIFTSFGSGWQGLGREAVWAANKASTVKDNLWFATLMTGGSMMAGLAHYHRHGRHEDKRTFKSKFERVHMVAEGAGFGYALHHAMKTSNRLDELARVGDMKGIREIESWMLPHEMAEVAAVVGTAVTVAAVWHMVSRDHKNNKHNLERSRGKAANGLVSTGRGGGRRSPAV